MNLLFAGDIVINEQDVEISDQLKSFINSCEYKICNFEGPIPADKNRKIIKTGPHVFNSFQALQTMKNIGFNVAALANNHIMDFGKDSLLNTISLLENDSIKVLGAGDCFTKAYIPLVLENTEEKICIINACQAEFGVLKDGFEGAGYAWICSPFLKKTILNAVKQYDSVILYLHAGLECEIFPLPELKSLYHEFADILNGKGIIIGNHPHIIQGYELYNNTPIFYSLGNFCFPKENNTILEWNRSLTITYDTTSKEFVIRPVKFETNTIDFDESEKTKNDIIKRSDFIKNDKVLNQMAYETAERAWNEYYKNYYKTACNNDSISNYSILRLIKILIKKSYIQSIKQKKENRKQYK